MYSWPCQPLGQLSEPPAGTLTPTPAPHAMPLSRWWPYEIVAVGGVLALVLIDDEPRLGSDQSVRLSRSSPPTEMSSPSWPASPAVLMNSASALLVSATAACDSASSR